MSRTRLNPRRLPWRVIVPIFVVRGSYGLTLGLYLFLTALVIVEGLAPGGAALDVPIVVFGMAATPGQWATYTLSLSVCLVALLDLPTGVFADLMGRKTSTVLSFIARTLFFVCMVLAVYAGKSPDPEGRAWTVVWAMVGRVLFALGYTLLNGAFLAWVQDALEEEGQGKQLTVVLAWGLVPYWAAFPIGSLFALYMHSVGLTEFAFILGAGVCMAAAVATAIMMRENQFYEFFSVRGLFTRGGSEVLGRGRKILIDGVAIFRNRPQLWVVAAAGMAVIALIDLIDFDWTVVVKDHFDDENLISPTKPEGLLLILTFSGSMLVGHLVMLALLTAWRRWGRGTAYDEPGVVLYGAKLVWWNAALNVLFAAPVFLAILLIMPLQGRAGGGATEGKFWLFLGLMAFHKLVEGALQSPRESLDNIFIPAGSQERATVLSLLTLLRKISSAGLMYLIARSLGHDRHMLLLGWAVPATLILMVTPLLLYVGLRTQVPDRRSPPREEIPVEVDS